MARKWKATATYAQTRQLAASSDLPIDSESLRVGARHVSTAATTEITAPMTAPSADNCSKRTNQRPSDEITQNDSLENISSTVTARAMNAEHSRIAVRVRPLFASATGAGSAAAEREKRRRRGPSTRISKASTTTPPPKTIAGCSQRLSRHAGGRWKMMIGP